MPPRQSQYYCCSCCCDDLSGGEQSMVNDGDLNLKTIKISLVFLLAF